MAEVKKSRKKLKICCGITVTTLIILVVVFISLFFTVFKPKDPRVSLHPTRIENFEINLLPFSLNANLTLVVTIKNPNLAKFKLKNATASVNYHGILVGEMPIHEKSVPAKGVADISTYASLTANKLISNPKFLADVSAGRLNLTATANLVGKGYILNFIKLSAKAYCYCDISIHILTQTFESSCSSKLKI